MVLDLGLAVGEICLKLCACPKLTSLNPSCSSNACLSNACLSSACLVLNRASRRICPVLRHFLGSIRPTLCLLHNVVKVDELIG